MFNFRIIIEGEPLIYINRDILDEICKNIINEIRDHMCLIIKEMEARRIEIHDVLLVGGSTRLHFIREIIDSVLIPVQKSEYRYDAIVIAEEAIALGCAIHGPKSPIEVVNVETYLETQDDQQTHLEIPDDQPPDPPSYTYHNVFIILGIVFIVIVILVLISMIIDLSFFINPS